MDHKREQAYSELFAEIGNTPLVEYSGDVPNGNRILIKQEWANPYGQNHYDRVYARLFHAWEQTGRIRPGDKILETTSGSAGVSFASIGRKLGYECLVAIPAGGEKAREDAIVEHLIDRDHLITTPSDDYISGFPSFLQQYLKDNNDVFFLNHSMGKRGANNDVSLTAMDDIAREVAGEGIDIYVPAIGNGTSVLGVGQRLKELGTRIVGFEPFQSAVTLNLLKPGVYQRTFGIEPGSLPRHKMPGTSFNGIDFPHIRNAVESGLLDDVVLVSDRQQTEAYRELGGSFNAESLVHWDQSPELEEAGRTTRAGLAVALKLAEETQNQTLMIIGYDTADRYDSPSV